MTPLNELLEIGKRYRVRFDAHLLLFGTPKQASNTTMEIIEKMNDGKFKVRFDVYYGIPNGYEILSPEEIQSFIKYYKNWEVINR